MKLIERFSIDIRGPDMQDSDAQNMINEKLMKLQVNNNGGRNKVEIIDIKEVNKDSGTMILLVMYEDKGLDVMETPSK